MHINETNKGLIQLALVVGFILFSYSFSKYLESSYEPLQHNGGAALVIPVDAQKFTPQPYYLSFEVTGTLVAQNTLPVMPQVSGRVTQVNPNFYPGGTFEENEPLFTIDSEYYALAVKQAAADVDRVTADLALEQAEIDAAIKGWGQLNGNAPVPKLVAREPQLARAIAQAEVAQLQLERAQLDLDRTLFKLPFSGRVVESAIAPGQYVSVGQGYGQVFDQQMLEVKTSLDPQKLYWLQEAQSPQIQVLVSTPHGTKSYPAHLARTVTNIDIATRYATAFFAFDSQGDKLIPGTFMSVAIKTDPKNDVIVIPADAIQTDGNIWMLTQTNTLTAFHPNILAFEKDSVAIQGIEHPVHMVTSRLAGGFEGMSVAPTPHRVAQQEGAKSDV